MSPAPPISVQGRPSSYFPPRSQGDPLERLRQTVSHPHSNLPAHHFPSHWAWNPESCLQPNDEAPHDPDSAFLSYCSGPPGGSVPASPAAFHPPASGHVHPLFPVPSYSPLSSETCLHHPQDYNLPPHLLTIPSLGFLSKAQITTWVMAFTLIHYLIMVLNGSSVSICGMNEKQFEAQFHW